MPVTIKSSQVKVKGTDGYVGIDALADSTTASRGAAITSAGATVLENIQEQGTTTEEAVAQAAAAARASIPGEYTQLSDDVSGLKSALTSLETKTFAITDVIYSVDEIPSITKLSGKSGSAGSRSVVLTNNANYDSYWFITNESTTLYASAISGQYMDICVVEGATGNWIEHTNYIEMFGTDNTGVRYRTNDNTIPTESNPLTISQGTLVSFTVTANAVKNVGFKNIPSNILAETVILNNSQIGQINKQVKIQYNTGTGEDSSSEWVDVYIPKRDKYIKYVLVHTISAGINADVWRIANAYVTNNDHVVLYALTTPGEWELAVKIQGRSDFSGGYAHGDETLIENPVFFVNGLPVDITTFTTLTSVDKFSITERTNLYDPNDSVSIIAKHGSEHIFDKNGMTIKQGVLWLWNYTMSNCYLAMLPIAKTVVTHFLTNYKFLATQISGDVTEVKATYAKIYGDSVSCEFSVPKYNPESLYFFMTDNGGNPYYKCYFAIDSRNGVANSDFWDTETHYDFSI